MDPKNPDDPKGLIRESYRIDGITAGECRSILVDWALSLPLDADPAGYATRLLTTHAGTDHPMTHLLAEVANTPPGPNKRRGGRAARFATADTPDDTPR